MNLYEIANQYQHLLDQSFNPETGEINEYAIAKLDETKEDMEEKGIAISSYIQNLEAEEMAVDAAIDRMQIRKNQLTKKVEYLVEYLRSNMERCGIKQISCPYFVIKLKKCPVSLEITDEKLIPDYYKVKKSVTSIDKVSIKEDLAEGLEIPGAKLKQRNRLEIK